MRLFFALVLVFNLLATKAQRVEFHDPDLTFSFKKPKGWEIIDNGYVVKVCPSPADTSILFLSITYFEDPQPTDITLQNEELSRAGESKVKLALHESKIAGEAVRFMKSEADSSVFVKYYFYKYGQRFEIETRSPLSFKRESFERILKSLRIEQ